MEDINKLIAELEARAIEAIKENIELKKRATSIKKRATSIKKRT